MAPRASGRQYGAPRPVNAGTSTTPPASGTVGQPCHLAGGDHGAQPSRSHCTTAPPMNTLPSSA